ncbi:MAG TPA: HAD family hydrolase, partial [Longimicrobiales bacterium]|nr:HAD family hydrolase [Longimicrobiales bacterium]
AAFVDRDGTIIREREYLSDPEGVALIPGAAGALRRLADAGYPTVVVSNQSGIARGYYSEAQYRAVQERMLELLADEGVEVLGSYHCPHHPEITGPCGCRKPGAGLFVRAIREHHLDPARSLFVGDRLRDLEASRRLGGLAVLVRTGHGAGEPVESAPWVTVREDLAGAVDWFLERAGPVDTSGGAG